MSRRSRQTFTIADTCSLPDLCRDQCVAAIVTVSLRPLSAYNHKTDSAAFDPTSPIKVSVPNVPIPYTVYFHLPPGLNFGYHFS